MVTNICDNGRIKPMNQWIKYKESFISWIIQNEMDGENIIVLQVLDVKNLCRLYINEKEQS